MDAEHPFALFCILGSHIFIKQLYLMKSSLIYENVNISIVGPNQLIDVQ